MGHLTGWSGRIVEDVPMQLDGLALTLDRKDPRPLGTQIADQVRSAALAGRLRVGTRLPSSRRLAADLAVARGVVEQAWQQLHAEGWLETRTGSGTFLGVGALPAGARPAPPLPTTAGPDTGTAPPVLLDAGTPLPLPERDPVWRRAWREVAHARVPRGYEDEAGLPELRSAIADRLGRTRGLTLGPEQVLVTSGTVGGFRHLLAVLGPGAVGVEDPGYRAVVATAAALGRVDVSLPVTGVPRSLEGLAVAYLTPAHQHPTGRVMPAADRAAWLSLASEADCLLVEDDYDSEFRWDVAPVPALAAQAPGQVAYLGTASKTVLPGLRLGWAVLPEPLHERVCAWRRDTLDVPAWPVQRAFTTLLRDGFVDARVRAARRVYADRAARVVEALSPYAELAGPPAGMYTTWLLDHDRAVRARAAALAAGYRVNLLADYCRRSDLTGLLVGVGGPDAAGLDAALAALVGSLRSR